MISKSSISIAALTVALLAGPIFPPAYAADVNDRGGLKDDKNYASGDVVVNWSGVYLQGQAGYSKAQHDVEAREYVGGRLDDPRTVANEARDAVQLGSIGLDGIGGDGFIGGGRLGYDLAMGRFLVGVFGEYNFSNVESTLTASIGPASATYTLEKDDEWTAGIRAGFIVAPRTLIYGLVGYTESDFSISGPGVTKTAAFNPERTLSGFTVGTGVEYAVASNIFLGLEGLYTKYGSEKWYDDRNAAGNGTVIDAETDELKVMLTAKVKLNGFGR